MTFRQCGEAGCGVWLGRTRADVVFCDQHAGDGDVVDGSYWDDAAKQWRVRVRRPVS